MNYTNSSVYVDDFWNQILNTHNIYVVLQSILIPLILITNIALIVLIVTSAPQRQKLGNQMLVSMSVANLLEGAYVAPLEVDFASDLTLKHSCLVKLVLSLLSLSIQDFVEFWTIVLLLLYYFARLCTWQIPPAWLSLRCHPYLLQATGYLYVLIPWVVALAVVVPVVYTARVNKISHEGRNVCYIELDSIHYLALDAVTCFLPVVLILLLVLAVAVQVQRGWGAWMSSSESKHNQRSVEEGSENPNLTFIPGDVPDIDPAIVYVLVAMVTVLLLLPLYLAYTVFPFEIYTLEKVKMTVFSKVLKSVTPNAQACLWMGLQPELRDRIVQLWTSCRDRLVCLCCHCRTPPQAAGRSFVPHVTFSNLREE